jgi:TRAP transporter TAXI family solute receptor
MDLASARDITLIPIPDDGLAEMQKLNPGYRRIEIPAGSYPEQAEAVPTIGYATHLIARCSLDEETVHGVLKAVTANMGDLASIASAMKGLTPADMAADVGVPLHPGAERFYREQGVL